jgi:hypothetical protein
MISNADIQQIELDLKSVGVNYLPLQQELIDHICIDIESKMKVGKNFQEAYQDLKSQYIDSEKLIEIQDDTKNLLDYKSIFLKRILLIVSAITLVGFCFKTFRISGSNVIQFLSFQLLCILFFKVGYYFYQDKRQQNLKKLYAFCFYTIGLILPVAYFIYSFQSNMHVIATNLNMLSYLLLSLSLTLYFSSITELNIFGITNETRKIDISIAFINLGLALLSIIFQALNYFMSLKYLLIIILGINFLFAVYYLLIKQKFKNKLTSLLIISSIIIHIYHLPIFIRQIFE